MGAGYRAFDIGCGFAGLGATRACAHLNRVDAAGQRIRLQPGEPVPGLYYFVGPTQLGDQTSTSSPVAAAPIVAVRTARDATLAMPALLLPSVQVNIRAGRLPEPDANGVRYLKLPLDRF